MQLTIKVDANGAMALEADVNEPVLILRMLHAASGAVMEKLPVGEATKPNILVPSGFAMPRTVPGIRAR